MDNLSTLAQLFGDTNAGWIGLQNTALDQQQTQNQNSNLVRTGQGLDLKNQLAANTMAADSAAPGITNAHNQALTGQALANTQATGLSNLLKQGTLSSDIDSTNQENQSKITAAHAKAALDTAQEISTFNASLSQLPPLARVQAMQQFAKDHPEVAQAQTWQAAMQNPQQAPQIIDAGVKKIYAGTQAWQMKQMEEDAATKRTSMTNATSRANTQDLIAGRQQIQESKNALLVNKAQAAAQKDPVAVLTQARQAYLKAQQSGDQEAMDALNAIVQDPVINKLAALKNPGAGVQNVTLEDGKIIYTPRIKAADPLNNNPNTPTQPKNWVYNPATGKMVQQ